jgi:hypothetical protein
MERRKFTREFKLEAGRWPVCLRSDQNDATGRMTLFANSALAHCR